MKSYQLQSGWPLLFCACSRAAGTCDESEMASEEDVIEPVAVSSATQNLGRRRFSHDVNNLSPDELDGLISSSGKKWNKERAHLQTLMARSEWFNWGVLIFRTADGRPFVLVHHLPEIKHELYLMPNTPVTCRVDNTEKYTTRSKVHLFNLFFSFTS